VGVVSLIVVAFAAFGGGIIIVVFGMIVLDAMVGPHGLGHGGRECTSDGASTAWLSVIMGALKDMSPSRASYKVI
jgi:hypothetical protein